MGPPSSSGSISSSVESFDFRNIATTMKVIAKTYKNKKKTKLITVKFKYNTEMMLTWSGWVKNTEEKSDIITDVSHFVQASLPKLMPLITMKNIETTAITNEST